MNSWTSITLFAMLSAAVVQAADPVVSNVRAERDAGTKRVNIDYDVADADGDRLVVSVAVAVNGVPIPARSFKGDVWSGLVGDNNVTPGKNRRIVWDAGVDWNGLYSSAVRFKVTAYDGMLPNKRVTVTPIGPNNNASYWGASGLGDGMVYSEQAISIRTHFDNYFFDYDPEANGAMLIAVPYKTGNSGYYCVTNYNHSGIAVPSATRIFSDSFFFVWAGPDEGIPDDKLNPVTSTSTTWITLPSAYQGSFCPRDVQAVFSREWRIADNMGDINQDGIPDKIAFNIENTVNNDFSPAGLTDLSGYNRDVDASGTEIGDYLPVDPAGMHGNIDFRPVPDVNGGNEFTALIEIRGFDPGLNMEGVSSSDGNVDEPRTDPTRVDTDGDGFPDGWEYYFWYNAKINHMTGLRYNPNVVGLSSVIPSTEIITAFDPVVAATNVGAGNASDRDFDNDGLKDREELIIGTNPINWDTNSDGVRDGW